MRNVGLTTQVVVALAVYAAGLLAAAVTDLRARRIPNAIVAPLIAAGIGYNAMVSGWRGAGSALLGLAAGIGILLLPFMARMIGGGDVKLLGAIGAWLGPAQILWVALWTAALCGVLVAALLARHATLRRQVITNMTSVFLMRSMPQIEERPRSYTVPVGAALAAAALWVAIAKEAFPHA